MTSLLLPVTNRTFRPLSGRLRALAQRPVSTIACSPNILAWSEASPGRKQHHTSHLASAPYAKENLFLPRSSNIKNVRSFSGTAQRPVKAIINPRKDDEGNEMLVDITPRAANRLHSIAEKDQKPTTCLRVTVESGGCHGFQYLMSLTTLDSVSHEEDTVFESEDGKNAKVVMDEPSLELLKGSKIDYTMELIGSQFKVTGIPGAKSSCGCGTSFDIQA